MVEIDIEDVRDFFPQDYFGEEEEPEISFLDTSSFGWPPSIDANPKDIVRNVVRNRKKVRQRQDPVVRKERPPSKPVRYHYLPNPEYAVMVNNVPCSKVGRTWVARFGKEKWVMLKKANLKLVKSALARKCVPTAASEFVYKAFASPVHIIRLWNFYDPARKTEDLRFFWVQTIFNA